MRAVLLLSVLAHVLHCWGSKVEESFPLQATHDLLHSLRAPAARQAGDAEQAEDGSLMIALARGLAALVVSYSLSSGLPSSLPTAASLSTLPRHVRTAFDHFTFPGVVPRTFVGSVVLAALSLPVLYGVAWVWALLWGGANDGKDGSFGDTFPQIGEQIVVRAVLGMVNVVSMMGFCQAVGMRFGLPAARWTAVLTAVQFHMPFYMSRTLPNTFALVLVMRALEQWLQQNAYSCLATLTTAMVIFRCDVAVLLLPVGLLMLLGREVTIVDGIKIGVVSVATALLVTVAVDSFFWQQWPLWPEGFVLFFNTVQNKSAEWGTQPVHWYFTSALPRMLAGTALLIPFGLLRIPVVLRRKDFGAMDSIWQSLLLRLRLRFDFAAIYYGFPAVVAVALYSLLPHKEVRFIFFAMPLFSMLAGIGAQKLVRCAGLLTAFFSRALITVALFSTLIATWFIFRPAAVHNYPGAVAFRALHHVGPMLLHQRSVMTHHAGDTQDNNAVVHIGVTAAMTGVSRFGEEYRPHWTYSKEENLTRFQDFDFLITADPMGFDKKTHFEPVIVVEHFDPANGLRALHPNLRIATINPALNIRNTVKYWHSRFLKASKNAAPPMRAVISHFMYRIGDAVGWLLGTRMTVMYPEVTTELNGRLYVCRNKRIPAPDKSTMPFFRQRLSDSLFAAPWDGREYRVVSFELNGPAGSTATATKPSVPPYAREQLSTSPSPLGLNATDNGDASGEAMMEIGADGELSHVDPSDATSSEATHTSPTPSATPPPSPSPSLSTPAPRPLPEQDEKLAFAIHHRSTVWAYAADGLVLWLVCWTWFCHVFMAKSLPERAAEREAADAAAAGTANAGRPQPFNTSTRAGRGPAPGSESSMPVSVPLPGSKKKATTKKKKQKEKEKRKPKQDGNNTREGGQKS